MWLVHTVLCIRHCTVHTIAIIANTTAACTATYKPLAIVVGSPRFFFSLFPYFEDNCGGIIIVIIMMTIIIKIMYRTLYECVSDDIHMPAWHRYTALSSVGGHFGRIQLKNAYNMPVCVSVCNRNSCGLIICYIHIL